MYLNSAVHCLFNSIAIPLSVFFSLSHIISFSYEEKGLAAETTQPFRISKRSHQIITNIGAIEGAQSILGRKHGGRTPGSAAAPVLRSCHNLFHQVAQLYFFPPESTNDLTELRKKWLFWLETLARCWSLYFTIAKFNSLLNLDSNWDTKQLQIMF